MDGCILSIFILLFFKICFNNHLVELIASGKAEFGWCLLCVQYHSDVGEVESYLPFDERVLGEEEKADVVNIGEDGG